MKKILVILGSLRAGNTLRTVKQVEAIHRQAEACEYEYLLLKDLHLELCRGCFSCIANGEQTCPLKDDRDLIVQKIEEADGVILACPNYVMNVPWLTKNFMDRFAYLFHRPRYFGKKFMTVVTSGSFAGVKNAEKALAGMASGGTVVSRLIVYRSPGMNEEKQKKQDTRVKKAAQRWIHGLNRKVSAHPPFSVLPWFAAMKTASLQNPEAYPADSRFYRDLDFFPGYTLTPIQRGVLAAFEHTFRFLLKTGAI